MRVLIADQDRDTIATLDALLRNEGHEVWYTQDSLEVTDAVRELKPQVVLLDVAMQEPSGYDLAEELCREYGSDCPVLVALAGPMADRRRLQASGFHHLVAKPCDAEEVLAFVALFEP